MVKRIHGQPALLKKLDRVPKKQAPPLPYNLSALQIDAAKQFGFSAKVVLDVCQTLYERHKVITYPRSDNRYLPKGHFFQAKSVISAISKNKALTEFCQLANPAIKSKAWNDAKVAAHHAIIPTAKNPTSLTLSHVEEKVYSLIAKHYLAQFYEAWQFQDTKAEFVISGGLFVAKERITLAKGWKELFEKNQTASSNLNDRAFKSMKAGESYLCEYGELLSKMTQAPKHFTDATILAAMTGIARFVKDPDIKKILKDTDGLGTEATRAGILELLFKRQFLERQGKQIRASQAGKTLILALPEEISTPDMTAHWENRLTEISEQTCRYNEFMEPLKNVIINYMNTLVASEFKGIASVKQTRTFKKKRRQTSNKTTSKSN